jgi:hypothetical protein
MRSPLLLLGLCAASVAAAQDVPASTCFVGASAAVDVGDSFRLGRGCRYALDPSSEPRALPALEGREVDFLEVYGALGGTGASDPRLLVARPRRGEVETLFLRYCSHYLIEEQLGFRLDAAPDADLAVERVRPSACGAAAIELRAFREAEGTPPRLRSGTADAMLGVDAARLPLSRGGWTLYAARPGSTVGLRVGVLRSERVVTPLQAHLRAAARGEAGPLFEAHVRPGGPGMILEATAETRARPLLWPELRTASGADLLWLVGPDGRVVRAVDLEAGEAGGVRLPDSLVRTHMTGRYGDVGRSLTPAPGDWRTILGTLRLCLTPTYQRNVQAARGATVPEESACVGLTDLTVLPQVDASAGAPARLCAQRDRLRLSTGGDERASGDAWICELLPELGDAGDAPMRVLTPGDRVRLQGDGTDGLCVLVDDRPIALDENGEATVPASGLLEVRQGGGDGCTSTQAMTRLRWPVVDPAREWHPVGLYDGASTDAMTCAGEGGAPEGGQCPWRGLAHDEENVFSFVRSQQRMDFRLSTSPAVAASIASDPAATTELSQTLPILGGVAGTFEGPRPPALVVLLRRSATCPDEEELETLRAVAPLNVDALPPDARFHVFLASVEGPPEAPRVHCVAQAAFRVRHSRALWAASPGDAIGLEAGVLGDTRLVLFFNDPVALGGALPVAWFRLVPAAARWIALDASASLVVGAAFDPAELSRVGGALSASLELGIPDYAPRLLGVGVMLNAAFETNSVDNPIVSGFVSLNLAQLIDLAGGR